MSISFCLFSTIKNEFIPHFSQSKITPGKSQQSMKLAILYGFAMHVAHYTLLIAKIISVKNARAWVSMVFT
jgi:hypothetical protein